MCKVQLRTSISSFELVPKNWTDGLALDLISNARERIDDDEQDPPESWIGIQGESGAGGPEGRVDGGGNLREARASPDAGQRVETAAGLTAHHRSSRKGPARPRRTVRPWSESFTNRSASRKWNWIFWHASSVTEPGGEASDDRQAEREAVVNPAVPVAGAQPFIALLSSGKRQYGRSGSDGADRPSVHGDALLRLPQDDGLAAPGGSCRQSQAGPPADASDGSAGDLAEARHQQAEPRAQDLSVPAARPEDRPAQPGVGDRYHVHPDAQRVLLPGGHHGLAQQEGADVAAVQYHGRDLLRRGARGSLG